MTNISTSTNNSVVSKKNPIAFDIFTNTLTVNKPYYKKAMIYGSPESMLIRQILSENSGCTVVVVESNKETYKGMNLALIKEFIRYHEDKIRLEAEYSNLEKVQGEEEPEFPLVKKWFLKNFPKMNAEKMSAFISDRKIELAEDKAKESANQMGKPIAFPADAAEKIGA